MQNESGALKRSKNKAKRLRDFGIFVDTANKMGKEPRKVFNFIRNCRSDLYICEYAKQNEDFRAFCDNPSLQIHWLNRYFELSEVPPFKPQEIDEYAAFYSEKLNLFETFQGQVYFNNLLSEANARNWDHFEHTLRETLDCGSLKALRWYLDAILSGQYKYPLFEKNEENLMRVAEYANHFARIRLYGSMGYLLWAETVTHLILLDPTNPNNPARFKTLAELIKIAEYLSTHEETAEVNTYLTPLLAHTNDVFAGNSLEIHSYRAAYDMMNKLQLSIETTNHCPPPRGMP